MQPFTRLLTLQHRLPVGLSKNSLTGSLPTEISHLRKIQKGPTTNLLVEFDLRHNMITHLPTQLGLLENMDAPLDLTDNRLCEIPTEVAVLSDLILVTPDEVRYNAVFTFHYSIVPCILPISRLTHAWSASTTPRPRLDRASTTGLPGPHSLPDYTAQSNGHADLVTEQRGGHLSE